MRLMLIASLAAASLPGQVARLIPREMVPLTMLQGEWHAPDGWIDFRFGDRNLTMTARGRADKPNSPWRDMISLSLKDGIVYADFTDSNGQLVHYHLRDSTGGTLVFSDDPALGKLAHTMTYARGPNPEQITYRLETGDKVTDSGVMMRRSLIRPLSE